MMGALLVEKKIITNEQLQQALVLQQESGELIGEILVDAFGVSRVEIAGVLAEQWTDLDKVERAETAARAERMPPAPVEPLASMEVRLRRPLGQILVEYGIVTEQQVEAAIAAQSSSPARLGEILIEQGVITRMDLASALAEQWSPPPTASSPLPVATSDREPSHARSPIPVAPAQVWSEEDRVAIAELEQRLRVVERSTGGMPWQEDLRLVTFDLRAAIGNVERRLEAAEVGVASKELVEALEAVSVRIETLESASTTAELATVRQELEEQKTRPVTVAGLDEIRAAIGRLEERPDRADEIAQLAQEISVLTARLDQLTDVEALQGKLETIAGQTEAAQAGFAGLERRLDDLAGLESRLDAVANRVPDASLLDELALRVDEAVASSTGVDTDGLTARIDALEQDGRAGSTALERLTAELGELGGRTQEQLAELASLGTDTAMLDELRARVDELAGRVVEPDLAPVEELRARRAGWSSPIWRRWKSCGHGSMSLRPVSSRIWRRWKSCGHGSRSWRWRRGGLRMHRCSTSCGLGSMSLPSRVVEPDRTPLEELRAPLDELRARLDELAVRVVEPDLAPVEELRARVDHLTEVVERAPDASLLDELRTRVDELAGRVEPDPALVEELRAPLDELRARVDELAGRVVEPDQAPLDELRARLDELAGRVVEPDQAPLDELRARLDELAARVEPDTAPLDELRARLDELAARVVEPNPAPLYELQARVDELAGRVVEPDTAPFAELRARLDDLAGRVVEPDPAPLDALRARVDELAGRVVEPDTAPLDALRESVRQLQELAAATVPDEMVAGLEARVAGLEQVAAGMPAEDLRTEVQRLTESTVVECQSLVQVLSARVDEIATSVPPEQDLLELRSRIDELAARPTGDQGLQARISELSTRLDDLGRLEPAVADIQTSLAGLDTARAEGAAETGARLADLAGAVDSLAGLESRLRKSFDRKLADQAEGVASRLDGTESRLDALVSLDERVAALALEVEQRPDGESLAAVAAELRVELAALAARPVVADPADRLEELSRRIEGTAEGGRERIDGVAEELNVRVSQLGEELGHRLDELGERANGLVSRDEAATAAAEHADWVRSELEALREWAAAQATAADAAVAKADRKRASSQQELSRRLDESVAAIRSELDAHGNAVAGNAGETSALQARVEELHQAMSERAAWEARFESALDERLDTLAARIAGEVTGARDDARQALRAVRDETSSLGARIDELHGLRDTDQEAARAGTERLAERIEVVAEIQEDSWEATRAAAQDLSARIEASAAALRAEAAEARAAADELTVRIQDLYDLRTDDLAAAELAGAELAARLDDHAVRSAAEALELERVLRHEVDGIAARLEERDASGIEAREELRGELERVASSVGWRLERIEESLASDQSAELQAKVAELAGRLDEQAALGQEQVRVTERALRKGLASLGERLVDTESAYADAGNALRRSIERLGAAVVEADARMADQVPVSEAEGCVAFAPTPDGYRLVEIPGPPPEIGAEIVLEVCDGPLVVTRYGRSPLPLDSRPCAYLDRG